MSAGLKDRGLTLIKDIGGGKKKQQQQHISSIVHSTHSIMSKVIGQITGQKSSCAITAELDSFLSLACCF